MRADRGTREYTYDSLHRVSTVTDEDGMVTKYVYADDDDTDNDSDGTTDETDEWGGQVVEVIRDYGAGDLNLTVAEYEYDDHHLAMTKETDALGNETAYTYRMCVSTAFGRRSRFFRPFFDEGSQEALGALEAFLVLFGPQCPAAYAASCAARRGVLCT
ncbi:MAG: hypothetical protein R6X33_06115, partial [Candidatus Brocadiia bacterium]